jgi:hypothetical protein
MAQEPRPKASFYHSDELDKYKKLASIVAGKDLASAAEYMCHIFASSNIEFAFLGGYSMRLRGSGRMTTHLDIAAEVRMRDLREILIAQRR